MTDAPRRERRLGPDTVLRRADDVSLSLTGADTVRVRTDAGTVTCGYLGLRVLERFGRPTSLREIAAEQVTGAQQWIDLLDTVARLVDHGVLHDVDHGPDHRVATRSYWWDNPRPHIEMMDDVVRTRGFIDAIRTTVRHGDVVVDIGTGTGVLAMTAARCGARHVYAVEAGTIADRAERLIAANGLADVVTVVRGWSTSVSLPEPADVLVTETLGSDPLDERIVEIVTDARRRLLTPDARVIPSRLSVYATPIEVPDDELAQVAYTAGRAARWRADYDLDFSALVEPDRPAPRSLRYPTSTTRTWRRLASPVALAELDLSTIESTSVSATATLTVDRPGRLDGALLHFTSELAPGVTLSTDPTSPAPAPHWWNVLTLRPPTDVVPGQPLRLRYGWKAPGVPPGVTVETVD